MFMEPMIWKTESSTKKKVVGYCYVRWRFLSPPPPFGRKFLRVVVVVCASFLVCAAADIAKALSLSCRRRLQCACVCAGLADYCSISESEEAEGKTLCQAFFSSDIFFVYACVYNKIVEI